MGPTTLCQLAAGIVTGGYVNALERHPFVVYFSSIKKGQTGRDFKSIMRQVAVTPTVKAAFVQGSFGARPVLSASRGWAWSIGIAFTGNTVTIPRLETDGVSYGCGVTENQHQWLTRNLPLLKKFDT